jgi:hypothetical protein
MGDRPRKLDCSRSTMREYVNTCESCPVHPSKKTSHAKLECTQRPTKTVVQHAPAWSQVLAAAAPDHKPCYVHASFSEQWIRTSGGVFTQGSQDERSRRGLIDMRHNTSQFMNNVKRFRSVN